MVNTIESEYHSLCLFTSQKEKEEAVTIYANSLHTVTGYLGHKTLSNFDLIKFLISFYYLKTQINQTK